MKRSAGVLMHLTSLPSPYGIGTLGREAYHFVDFLKKSGQTYWQVLPVGPTSYGDSPYQSFSTFAGNPYLIDLDLLCEEGLLTKEEAAAPDWGEDPSRVDYEKLFQNRFPVLEIAVARAKGRNLDDFLRFERQHAGWLDNYALYMAVKESFGLKSWCEWPEESIRLHKAESVREYTARLSDRIFFWKYLQYLFFRQWAALKEYANRNGILLFGDMPIYVALDSADVWAGPELFWLDKKGRPVCVAGCPPDYFSETGQLWGNPLYNWETHRKTRYAWWIRRIRHASTLFDVTRIDHFRGFEAYYAIPYGEETAVNGSWKKGPGMKLFQELKKQLGKVPIIAEDLGFLTPAVHKLLKKSGYPGMKILQFAFDSGEENDYLPHNYNRRCVVYTGTHDNDTTAGWFAAAPKQDVEFAVRYCRLNKREDYHWGLIRTAYASVSRLAIVPMQDFLGLGSDSRMNTPSTTGGNWQWRMPPGAATPALAHKIRELTALYGRLEKSDDDQKEQE